jgi:N6-adenosine-specific RNA methylase IME4
MRNERRALDPPYRVIIVDPPWPYDDRQDDPSYRGTTPYPQMSIAEICALDVASIAAPDCILWLWTTNYHMRNAFAVLDAWGFEHRTILTWVKDRMGVGDWLRGQTEHVLMAGRGSPTITLTKQTTVLKAPAHAHSQKPEEFYKLVETLCPASRYAELFSRYPHSERWLPRRRSADHAGGRPMSGLRSRRKGMRNERRLVHALQNEGFAAEKISGMYKPGADISVPLLGVDRAVEVKSRSTGFAQLYRWLQDRDALVIRADRKEPLVVVPLKLAIEIAKAAERGKHFRHEDGKRVDDATTTA